MSVMSYCIAAAALLSSLVAAQAQQYRPSCLTLCTVNATDPCNAASLPALISCLDAECATNSALARFAISYSPKREYSCEQSQIPGADENSPPLTITGLGACATSPYDFQSFVSDFGNESAIPQLCRIKVYPKADCVGDATALKLDGPYTKCTFQRGRSARLDCSATHDNSAALHYAQALCGNLTSPSSNASTSYSTGPSSTGSWTTYSIGLTGTASASSNNRTRAYGSSSNTTALPLYIGIASPSNDASIAALLAVIAAIALL